MKTTFSSFLSFFLIGATTTVVAATEEITPPKIIDLSEPFEVGSTNNEDALEIKKSVDERRPTLPGD